MSVITGLLTIYLLGSVGLLAELILLEHTERGWQWVPIVVLGAGVVGVSIAWVRGTRALVPVLGTVSVAALVSGLVGMYLHLVGNREFESELRPAVHGVAQIWNALHGATPALAPGAMGQLGLIGLLAVHQLRARSHSKRKSATVPKGVE